MSVHANQIIEKRPMAVCPVDREPLIATLAFPKKEFICICCGRLYEFMFQNGPAAADPTPELDARYAELKAEWDEHVGGKLIPPRSWRLDTCDKCHSGGEYHREHATEQELAEHEEALAWLRERAGLKK
jgi:hypothetical protein